MAIQKEDVSVTRGQLAILPVVEGRSVERRIVNLAARLREPGAQVVDAEVHDLSVKGFMARTEVSLETGSHVWLKLPGLEPQNSRVIWCEDGKAGCEFTTPLHEATLEMLVSSGRPSIPRGHFGPQLVR
jgi:hypothetical protein